jgi:hypothetical protein
VLELTRLRAAITKTLPIISRAYAPDPVADRKFAEATLTENKRLGKRKGRNENPPATTPETGEGKSEIRFTCENPHAAPPENGEGENEIRAANGRTENPHAAPPETGGGKNKIRFTGENPHATPRESGQL